MGELNILTNELLSGLLEGACEMDAAVGRRVRLTEVLWQARFLTREQLKERVEALQGRGCFGESAWRDNFYRDMRVVKDVFSKAGFSLKYSRTPDALGYYLEGEPELHPRLKQEIAGAIGELDTDQLSILKRLSPAQKFSQATSIIDLAQKVVGQLHSVKSLSS